MGGTAPVRVALPRFSSASAGAAKRQSGMVPVSLQQHSPLQVQGQVVFFDASWHIAGQMRVIKLQALTCIVCGRIYMPSHIRASTKVAKPRIC